jgi:hypothetical protein
MGGGGSKRVDSTEDSSEGLAEISGQSLRSNSLARAARYTTGAKLGQCV